MEDRVEAMANPGIAVPVSKAEALPKLSIAVPAPKAEAIAKPKAKRDFSFEWFLVVTVLIVIIIGAYESLTEQYFPAYSILSRLHKVGYLKGYPITYEPGRGIWLLLGWIGSGMMVVMMLYSVRKRVSALSSLGSMRHWLSAHMFLGIMGPLLVALHTTFKFHGLVATSFWCMTVTAVFGILGRYIYVQIPRSITGTELGVKDIEKSVEELDSELGRYLSIANITNLLEELGVKEKMKIMANINKDAVYLNKGHISAFLKEIGGAEEKQVERGPLPALFFMMWADIRNYFKTYRIDRILKARYSLDKSSREEIIGLLKRKAALIRRKGLLSTSQRLLHHWHVLHIPLAIVMFLIMFIHIAVYYIFRAGI